MTFACLVECRIRGDRLWIVQYISTRPMTAMLAKHFKPQQGIFDKTISVNCLAQKLAQIATLFLNKEMLLCKMHSTQDGVKQPTHDDMRMF